MLGNDRRGHRISHEQRGEILENGPMKVTYDRETDALTVVSRNP
jgi:hypothetical protein